MRRNVTVSIAVVLGIVIGAIVTGSLLAGSLEPASAPAPTMQTLQQIPGAWDKVLPANDTGDPCNSSRFTCVFPDTTFPDGAAVRDNETGLVWERAPSTTTLGWSSAIAECQDLTTGGRMGWHVPMIEQIASLVDPSVPSPGPALPAGHPFENVSSTGALAFWAANARTAPLSPDFKLILQLNISNVNAADLNGSNRKWCVRGGQSFDGNTHDTLH